MSAYTARMPTDKKKGRSADDRSSMALYLGFVLLTSFFTYFYRYNYPQAVFWDEPYHIAAAEKYLSGVYFMEQHPPLGKLLIAAGEKIVNANPSDDAFITTDYGKNFDASFSFTGYRLFPSLLAWLTAPILFLIFFFFTRNAQLSALLSFVYIFDNAEIMHSRGAMVDTPLTFFGMLQVLIFLYIQENAPRKAWRHIALSALFGLSFGLAVCTKLVGLIFVLLIPAAIVRLYPDWKKIVLFLVSSFIGFTLAWVAVWQTHFALGSRIVPELSNNGYYEASEAYKQILAQHTNASIASFPVMMRDSLKYVTFYNKGVPRLDLCKPDENGSPAYFWPFGARSINYRWEKTSEGAVKYLYLQSNPVAWMCGLLGVALSLFYLIARILIPSSKPIKNGYFMLLFFGMYASYMIAIMQLDRVMYLYHYFIPLLFSFILFGLVVDNLDSLGPWKVFENRKIVLMTGVGLLIFASFQFYRPLSYYEPLKDSEFRRRAIFPLWELTCVDCEKKSGLVVPVHRN